ncbi:hypothetical protein NW767_015260 [Fusarium falciforme]|uniref:Amine oxidase n=1 Tax=Fusarium falciforme TaxID=195108 RepID=A0A9W8QV24_9HYPO|nr:hypothetical protein NW767_015260 [Fusarium falciforme]KAJ4178856.1 hypothetical protein NW755_012878 [Fusarium falciforme]KAJ4236798.1 hypothetical protein NW757_013374 [Fusarium falciforme]
MTTNEGFRYRPGHGLERGMKCQAAINPLRNIPAKVADVFDVIVLGAGYAGLTACRDLCTAGYKVLLLEARDRLGGRTYTTEVDGHLYEMGGTWIHWNQPHMYREMSRYGVIDMLDSTDSKGIGCNKQSVLAQGTPSDMSLEEAGALISKTFELLCDVDGKAGRDIIPFPHNPHLNPEARKWEKLSVADRLGQIASQLTEMELAILKATIVGITGNTLEASGFFDVLRWWALSGYTCEGLGGYTETFKLMLGQSDMVRRFFEEAVATGNLAYALGTHVTSIADQGNYVVAKTRSGEGFAGTRFVCTLPLNVLRDVQFEPALSATKQAAVAEGHINFGAKMHLEAAGTDLRTWIGASWPPERVLTGLGDGITPAGNTHVVLFGLNKDMPSQEDDARDFIADAERLRPMVVKQAIWHNWATDPLARGTWCMFGPDYTYKHLDALRERAGNILFASGDWALGWRGFIDGAIEEGARAAKVVGEDLGRPKRPTAFL